MGVQGTRRPERLHLRGNVGVCKNTSTVTPLLQRNVPSAQPGRRRYDPRYLGRATWAPLPVPERDGITELTLLRQGQGMSSVFKPSEKGTPG